jgi:hypothetical protein
MEDGNKYMMIIAAIMITIITAITSTTSMTAIITTRR